MATKQTKQTKAAPPRKRKNKNWVTKASILSGPGESRQASEEDQSPFSQTGHLHPPYEPESLARRVEESHDLRPNIDAYAVNIDGFGHRLEPTINLESEDADKKLRRSLLAEAVFDGAATVVTAEAIKARRLELESTQEIERLQIDLFFARPHGDHSFVELRRRVRTDLEETGNGYMEVVRNRAGRIANLVHSKSTCTRLMPINKRPTTFAEQIRVSDVAFRQIKRRRRFRRFVQLIHGLPATYFKEFRDPRIMSAKSGKYYTSLEKLREVDGPRAREASEMIHREIYNPRGPYGVPRWIGAAVAVVGTRSSEEVNADYFDNKAVPPMAVLVSGGRMGKGARAKLQNYIRDEIKNRKNFHSILILEATGKTALPGQNPPNVKIELVPLMNAQLSDALFQGYEERNSEKIGGTFRLPKILRGDIKDFNRSTSLAALTYAEQQVFQPERAAFDYMINTILFAEMGVRFWRFVSNSPVTTNPAEMSEILERLKHAMTPEEQRPVIGEMLNRELPTIEEEWVKLPPDVFLAGVGGVVGERAKQRGEVPRSLLDDLQKLRNELKSSADKQAKMESTYLKALEGIPREYIKVSAEEYASWTAADAA